MISITQNQDKYEIRFRYDPAVIELIKQVPSRRWNSNDKFWTIDRNKLGFLLAQFKGTPYENEINIQSEEHINENATLDSTSRIPNYDLTNVPFYIEEGKYPYNHQLDFMKYALSKQDRGFTSGFILADEPGLGKSVETCNLAVYNRDRRKFKHCLIICCINSSKYNWMDDIERHMSGIAEGYILGTRKKKRGTGYRRSTGTKERLADLMCMKMYGDAKGSDLPYFIITNIESIRAKQDNKYVIADKLIDLINRGIINMIAIDEVHKNMSPKSQQGKQILRIKKYTGSKVEWIPITGTPIVSKPTDVFLPLKLIDGHHFSSYYSWCKEFCIMGGFGDHDIVGYKNIPRLKTMLQANMLRRLKKEVLDLPEKIQIVEYVENTPYQQSLYDDIEEEIFAEAEIAVKELNPLTKFLRLRQVNGSPEIVDPSIPLDDSYLKYNAKLVWLLDKLEELTANGDKVIVFSNWVEVLHTLYKFVSKKYKTCCFTGTMSEESRLKHKQVFIHNPEYKVMLGTIGAMGTTHSFPGVTNEIFYDTPWTYVDRLQAEDRVHGIGRGSLNSTCNYYTVLTKDTVDERVWKIMYDKKDISGYIVDNKLDIRNKPDLFLKLLGR